MGRLLLVIFCFSSVGQAKITWDSKSCSELRFFETPSNRWKQITDREEGFRVAFQETGKRATRFLADPNEPRVIRPTTCLLYLPNEGGFLLDGRARLVATFNWRDDGGMPFTEGYRVDLSIGYGKPNDPSTLTISAVYGFQICRIAENCERMLTNSNRDF